MRILGLAILAMVLSACSLGYPSGTWRYRMTVEVETPEGLKTGSAVRQVHVQREYVPFQINSGADISVKGEAVVVDLGTRGVLFALLDGDDAYRVVNETFPWPGGPGGSYTAEGLRYYDGLTEGRAELAREAIPRMVTFKDRNDPKSVELVYAYKLNSQESKGSHKVYDETDNFEAMFGKGVKLKRVILEMTDDKVTKGIIEQLPWLLDYRNQLFDGRRFHTIKAENQLTNSLGMGSFSTGIFYPAEWQLNQPAPAKHR